LLDYCCLELLGRLSTIQPCLCASLSSTHLHARLWLIVVEEEDGDVVTAPVVAMGVLAAVQAEEAPSHPVVEEGTEVAAVDIVAAATAAEEIAAVATAAEEIVVVAIAGAEIAAGTVEVAIGAEVAVTVVAAADDPPRRSTRLPLEECPSPIPR